MRIGSLFSGAGGLDLAVQAVFGGEVVWHAEIDKAASKVLAHRFPGVPNLGDITQVDWATVHGVDVLCGGWPRQPFSVAGKREGANDDRALWPYVAGAVRGLRPKFVVLENVANVVADGELARAVGDLSGIGYDARWTCFSASSVGAPHQRNRCFIVAYPVCVGLETSVEREGRYESEITGSDGCRGALPQAAWGRYAQAISRWESLTRPAPTPTVHQNGRDFLNIEFAEWMMGWPSGWVSDPILEISPRDQLRIIGNGVVPQQAEWAMRTLMQTRVAV